jgi:hypothetical protein
MISQMAEFADTARPTVYKLVAELLGKDMLMFTRSVGGSKFYRLNVANPRIISMLQVDFEGINKELAAGAYDETHVSSKGLAESRAGSSLRGRLSFRRPTVPVPADPRRTVRRKRSKSSD